MILGLAAPLTFAGNERGNGGDGVVCVSEPRSTKNVELLDFFEARVFRGLEIVTSPQGDYREIVSEKLERLRYFDPRRAESYRVAVDEFLDRSLMLRDVTLVDISDSSHLAFPNNCQVEQLAIQRAPMFPQDKKYTINQDLWERLSAQGKAGLLLHEIVFGEALSLGHENSIKTRFFVSYLFSRAFETATRENYNEVLRLVDFTVLAGDQCVDFSGRFEQIEYYGRDLSQDTWNSMAGGYDFRQNGCHSVAVLRHNPGQGQQDYEEWILDGQFRVLKENSAFKETAAFTLKNNVIEYRRRLSDKRSGRLCDEIVGQITRGDAETQSELSESWGRSVFDSCSPYRGGGGSGKYTGLLSPFAGARPLSR